MHSTCLFQDRDACTHYTTISAFLMCFVLMFKLFRHETYTYSLSLEVLCASLGGWTVTDKMRLQVSLTQLLDVYVYVHVYYCNYTYIYSCFQMYMLTIATTWLLLAPAQLALGSLQNGEPQPIGFPAKVGQFGGTLGMTHDRTPIVFRRCRTQRFPWRPRFKGVLASW